MNKRTHLLPLLTLLLILIPTATAQPTKRIGPRMIYNPVDQEFLLFGGAHWQNGYNFYGDLWTYKPETNTWTKLETHNDPPPRFNHMLTYIPTRHQLFLYGGWSTNDKTGDTYIYDIETSTWTQLYPTDHPIARSDASIAYHPPTDTVILYSGFLQDDSHSQDIWTYSFQEENWIQQNPTNPPLGQYGHYMITTNEDQLLMYPGHWSIRAGGILINHGYGSNIWQYNPETQTWTEHQTAPNPPGRYWGQVTYDSTENRIILNGGHGEIDYDDTWLYNIDPQTWTQADTQVKPPPRGCAAIAYDPENHIAVLFGGFSENGQSLSDTWILDCTTLTWSQPGTETPTTEPPTETPDPPETTENQIPGNPTWLTLTTIALTILITRRRTN